MFRHSVGFVAALILALGVANAAKAQAHGFRFWTGNVNESWSVPGNWLPSCCVPRDTDFVQIGTIEGTFGDTTVVDDHFVVADLELYNDADIVISAGSSLTVLNFESIDIDRSFTLKDPGCTIFVNAGGQLVSSGDPNFAFFILLNGTRLELRGDSSSAEGGIVISNVSISVQDAAAGGHGEINFTHPFAGLSNNGQLFVSGRPGPSGETLPGTLTITTVSGHSVGLSGGTGDGVVNVDDGSGPGSTSLTLNVEAPIGTFSGQMDIGSDDTVNIEEPWEMNEGGALPAILNFNGAGTHTLTGGTLTVNGETTQVNMNAGTAVFENRLVFNGGTFRLADNAAVQFDGGTTALNSTIIDNASHITNGLNTTFIVNSWVQIGGSTVTAGEDFDWDGSPGFGNQTIVNAAGHLLINVENLNGDGTDTYHGKLTLNSGEAKIHVADNNWIIDDVLNLNNTTGLPAVLTGPVGESVRIGNDADLLTADVNVSGAGNSSISIPVVFSSDSDVNIASGATFSTANATFESVNGANNAEFTGSGTWLLAGTNTFSEATTINMTGGSVDLDNSSTAATVADDTFVNAPLTINAANLLSYGVLRNIGSVSSSDLTVNNTAANTGILTVNLDNPAGFWTVNNEGTLVLFNDAAEATLLAGSRVLIDGALNVTGDVRTDARLTIEGTVSINTPGELLRLSGGNLTDQPNTIASGTIHGPGILGADTGTSLRGNGVINANIDFDGTAELLADGGILTINGSILDANIVGTLDNDGVLNIVNPWNMSGAVGLVRIQGGELRGGAVTTAGFGIIGSGLVSAPTTNNTLISANSASGTLLVQTAANNNDWDGTTNTGQLSALSGGTLEIRDNALFGFRGTVSATTNGTVRASGFQLRFNVGSTLNLDAGTYRSTHQTFIEGTVTVGAGGGTLQNDQTPGFVFVSGSGADLTGDLRLESGTSVIAGAEFMGPGSLMNLALLRLEHGANLGVGIENQGDLQLGGITTGQIGQVTAGAFEQMANGELIIHLGGITSGAFDHLQIGGAAQLDGSLRLALTGGYVPVLGQGIEILMAELGVTGTFDSVIQPSGMPAGIVFAVQYGLKDVSLKVVVDAGLPGDYNDDGVVNVADFVVWRSNEGTTLSLPNDNSIGGTIGAAHYNLWRTNYGRTAGSIAARSAGAQGAIPEPTSLALVMLIGVTIAPRLRRRRARCR
jgi:autotransporter-associated beta strand protein